MRESVAQARTPESVLTCVGSSRLPCPAASAKRSSRSRAAALARAAPSAPGRRRTARRAPRARSARRRRDADSRHLEEGTGSPERRGKGVADAGHASAGGGVHLGDADADAAPGARWPPSARRRRPARGWQCRRADGCGCTRALGMPGTAVERVGVGAERADAAPLGAQQRGERGIPRDAAEAARGEGGIASQPGRERPGVAADVRRVARLVVAARDARRGGPRRGRRGRPRRGCTGRARCRSRPFAAPRRGSAARTARAKASARPGSSAARLTPIVTGALDTRASHDSRPSQRAPTGTRRCAARAACPAPLREPTRTRRWCCPRCAARRASPARRRGSRAGAAAHGWGAMRVPA